MKKNKIQFQKGLSLTDFLKDYGSEKQCKEAVFKLKWTHGFCCPKCGHNQYCSLKSRKLYQCNHCHHQTSLTVGTIYEQTKLPLTQWFLASYLITQSKVGISALSLMRKVGVSYNTALYLKHKLMHVMEEQEHDQPLEQQVVVDDAYWGGELSDDKRGRGSSNKTPFIAAVQLNQDGHPIHAKLHKVSAFKKDNIKQWATENLIEKTHVITDGLACFNGFDEAGFKHTVYVTGGGRESVKVPIFLWLNILLGNVKTAIHGTYHSVSSKHLPRYLAEFEYRFNRRFNLATLPLQLITASVQTRPKPYRVLKLAEAYW
jgi:transposase-like protein